MPGFEPLVCQTCGPGVGGPSTCPDYKCQCKATSRCQERGKKQEKAMAKAKAKSKAQAKRGKKTRVCNGTPLKTTASFERGLKRHLSPMALKVLLGGQRKSLKTSASVPAAAEPAEPAEPAASPAPADTDSIPTKLDQLRTSMKLLGVPEELLPQSVPRGRHSYTIKHPEHHAAVQVLHVRNVYLLNYDRTGAKPPNQIWSWANHGGVEEAWDLAKKVLDW